MPLYEYRCHACGQHAEFLQKLSEPDHTDCPHCHASQLQKLLAAPAFHLKGTGWYVTDFKNKDNEKDKTKTAHTHKDTPTEGTAASDAPAAAAEAPAAKGTDTPTATTTATTSPKKEDKT